MKIQKHKFYENKTKKYLLPIVKDYGQGFISKVNSLFKLAVGISDEAIPKNLTFDKHLFILVDASKNPKQFLEVLEWFTENDYLAFDYPFDDIEQGSQHMIVVKLSSQHHQILDYFKNSKFSRMYHKDIISNYFSSDDNRIKVLVRKEDAVQELIDNINTTYGSEIQFKDWEHEADYPLKDSEEKFNFNLVKQKEDGKKGGNEARRTETSGSNATKEKRGHNQ